MCMHAPSTSSGLIGETKSCRPARNDVTAFAVALLVALAHAPGTGGNQACFSPAPGALLPRRSPPWQLGQQAELVVGSGASRPCVLGCV